MIITLGRFAVQLKYEHNMDLRHLNEPKTGCDVTGCDHKKARMLKLTWFFSSWELCWPLQFSTGIRTAVSLQQISMCATKLFLISAL